MTAKRLRIVAVIGGLVCLAPALASPAGASAYSLTGAGSTLIAPLEARWAEDFNRKYNDSITYAAVGSGTGIAQISARSVDFGASDAPLTAAQAEACKGCIQIPWALTATGIGFNIPGIRDAPPHRACPRRDLPRKITTWNAPKIEKLNKGLSLPALTITPVFRSDGSGDTYAFTDYLSTREPHLEEPGGLRDDRHLQSRRGRQRQLGRDRARVLDEWSDRLHLGLLPHRNTDLPAAALQNAGGGSTYPNLSAIEEAAKSVKRVPANNEMHIVNPPKKYKKAYPLSTFTYAIVPKGAAAEGLLSAAGSTTR